METDRDRPLLTVLAWLRVRRSAVLLGALLLFVLLHPFTHSGTTARLLLDLFYLGVLMLGLWSLTPGRALGWWAWCLIGLVVALILLPLSGVVAPALALPLLLALLEGTLAVALLTYVMNVQRVTADKIFGAVAAYVLVAMLFTSLYYVLVTLDPTALFVGDTHDADGRLGWFQLFYFSVTVLTSTGFGEITPRTDHARAIVVVEQVVGVMYVAFLVARLANVYPRGR
jgi:hypothetical protein